MYFKFEKHPVEDAGWCLPPLVFFVLAHGEDIFYVGNNCLVSFFLKPPLYLIAFTFFLLSISSE